MNLQDSSTPINELSIRMEYYFFHWQARRVLPLWMKSPEPEDGLGRAVRLTDYRGKYAWRM